MVKDDKKIKILVCYHKKAKLFKDNVYVPIHGGRALAKENYQNGKISSEEFQWMESNLAGDDTGDNISKLNSTINEMSVLYWAWKNYDKLGYPDYIGLYHYRRKLDIKESKLQDILSKYYFIRRKPDRICYGANLYEQWCNLSDSWADNDYLEQLLNACKDYDLDLGNDIEKFFKSVSDVSWCNMFVMPREEFFRYCEFIFPLIFHLNKTLSPRKDRALGMFAERLTAYYLHKLAERETVYNADSKMCRGLNLLQKIYSTSMEGGHKVWCILGVIIKKKVA